VLCHVIESESGLLAIFLIFTDALVFRGTTEPCNGVIVRASIDL